MKMARAISAAALTLVAAVAFAEAPTRGDFDWRRFKGDYHFGQCSGGAIWSQDSELMFVRISESVEYTVNPNPVHLLVMRVNRSGRNPIVTDASLENINQGPQERVHYETGEVTRVWESYSTADGAYGTLLWGKPIGTGLATMHLTMDANGAVSYEMSRRFATDPDTSTERCVLTRVSTYPFGP